MKKKKPTRQRTALRAAQRSVQKLTGMREKLAALEPGGSESSPIVVESASVIEPRAEAHRCLRCGEFLRCASHGSRSSGAGETLREVALVCRACGAPRTLYFRIEQRLPN